MEKNLKIPKRVIFNVDEDFHKKLKLASTDRKMSISKYVTEAIEWRLKRESK